MIEKEDVIKLWRKDVPVDAIKTLNKLFADLHEALKWKEVYWEVAIKNWVLWCKEYESGFENPLSDTQAWEEGAKNVSAEARRIMQGKR